MREADVLVVGAGPVGSVAALALAQQGIRVLLCEAASHCAADLRASTFHPPTLEMLDELGVADELISYGLQAPMFHYRERRSGEIAAFDMTELAGDTRFPFRLQCEQHVLARKLVDRLTGLGVDVLFNHRAVSFAQTDESVVTAFETPFAIEKVRSRYVIAADGGNSIIRKWLGVEFEGFTYPEKFLCLSTPMELGDSISGLCFVNYIADPEEWLVLLRAPSVWRVLLPAPAESDDAQLLSDANTSAVFERLIGESRPPIEHRTIYRVHQRVVRRFNHGRVLLAGDAAHLNNPLGGFGMNSGIHDAWNLKDRLVAALADGHDDALFDHYDRQRRGVTHSFIQAQTMQNKELLEHGAEAGHARRFARMQAIAADGERRRDYLLRQSMIESLREAAAIA